MVVYPELTVVFSGLVSSRFAQRALFTTLLWLAGLAVGSGVGAGEIRFRDIGEAWGIRFRHHNGRTGEFYMPETVGAGVVLFDYDSDGDNDIFLVDSGELPGYEGEPWSSILYRNDTGRFVDVTERSGIRVAGYGMGATAGDIDGDLDLDLYVTAFGRNQLFRNEGDGTFSDITEQAGVGDDRWSTSAAFGDTDGDGDLDLYVANFVDFTFENNRDCGKSPELRSYCRPQVFEALQDGFFRNRGDGTFVEATEEAGLVAPDGKGLALSFGDIDFDGWLDLYVANDTTPNFLFRNLGDGRFEEIALLSGTAIDDRGEPESGMGVDIGDLDGDGQPEIMVTNFDVETNALYSSMASWNFIDRRYPSGLGEPSLFAVGFGLSFGDFDQDRDLDVVVANGHVIHNIAEWGLGRAFTYRQENHVFSNLGNGVFREVQESGMSISRVSRGLACGDLDGDGDLDLLITNSDEEAEVYENVTPLTGGWLQVDLRARGGNPFGVGSRLELNSPDSSQSREVRTGSSYLSQNAMTAHFGVGDHTGPLQLTVHWPGGEVRVLAAIPSGRRLRVVQ